jgi:alkaline phosphatase D
VKVGEVTDTSAIVWVRLTKSAERVADETPRPSRVRKTGEKATEPVETLPGACPGAAGRIRLRFAPQPERMPQRLEPAQDAGTVVVDAKTDFTHQFALKDLQPNRTYVCEITGAAGDGELAPLTVAQFRTAPRPGDAAPVTFTVVTGMMYKDLDHADGFTIYDSMLKQKPNFLVPTGDTVYYDNDDLLANSVPLARHHWHRIYSLPRLVAFHCQVPAYWEKDDHDTLDDDCWPGKKSKRVAPLTFEDGQKIFREQVPMGAGSTYRTFRWGKDLQIWLVEGRDYRSPNPEPDGPEKSIWGVEQKAWLRKSLLDSNAAWKVLISPTPIVGPDRGSKMDNHTNQAFAHEGAEMRAWFGKNLPDNFFIVCGDRHWQYHSIDPQTKVAEFSCGPASDQHAGGSPGRDAEYHQFHRVQGGYLSVNVAPHESGASTIAFKLHGVDGNVAYEYQRDSK